MTPHIHELRHYIESVRKRPFEWGKHDCLTFAVAIMKHAWRQDYTDVLGDYTDARGALDHYARLRGRFNVGTFSEIVDSKMPRVWPAKEGDIIGRPNDWMDIALGVFIDGVVMSPSKRGLIYEEVDFDDIVWRPDRA